ncbi:MAG: hypothetical protein JXA24_04520 [Proteobacteria bacterium]|nr:hypothetical protein [Pseudomonadota bacterium]
MGEKRVNLNTYCRSFEAMGVNPLTNKFYAHEICALLNPGWESLRHSSFYCGRPNKGEVFAKKKLSFKDRFGEDCNDAKANPFREMVSYFIAGACGLTSIPPAHSGYKVTSDACPISISAPPVDKTETERVYFREDLDRGIVNNTQKTYSHCLKGPKNCLKTQAADNIRWRWNAIIKYRNKLKEIKQTIVSLNARFNSLVAQVKGQYDFLLNIAGLNMQIPEVPENMEDYMKIIQILNLMIKIAEAKIAEEKEFSWAPSYSSDEQ